MPYSQFILLCLLIYLIKKKQKTIYNAKRRKINITETIKKNHSSFNRKLVIILHGFLDKFKKIGTLPASETFDGSTT